MEGYKIVVSVLTYFLIKKKIKSLEILVASLACDKTTGSFLIGFVGGMDISAPLQLARGCIREPVGGMAGAGKN